MEKSTMGRRLVIEVVPVCQAVRLSLCSEQQKFDGTRRRSSARHVLNVAASQSRRLGLSTFGMVDGFIIGILGLLSWTGLVQVTNGQGLGRFDTPLATLFASDSSMVAVGTNESQSRGLGMLLLLRRRRRCRGRKVLSWKGRFMGGLSTRDQGSTTMYNFQKHANLESVILALRLKPILSPSLGPNAPSSSSHAAADDECRSFRTTRYPPPSLPPVPEMQTFGPSCMSTIPSPAYMFLY
ncbi:hypothetical protein KCU99_g75, partial [Aureobasidium melanogenum]